MPTDLESTMNTSEMVIGLFGGLALFLFGLEQLAKGLKIIAGKRMKHVLAKLTRNRFSGMFTGILVTGAVQSSSVTTVLLVGFISAGLMTMNQAVGVIMGANIGSTFTAQIIAFKVTKLALVFIAIGFAGSYLPAGKIVRPYARSLMALGLIFFGMAIMGDAARPLRTNEGFIGLMADLESPLMGILFGALFTALVQSSAATMGIVIMLAGQQLITLEAGIALAFGANIGTCITAMLASIGKPREAVRAALVHVFFNVIGVALWLAFIGYLARFVAWITPASSDVSRQIANAHTIFNVANTVVLIWFAGLFAWFAQVLIPQHPEPVERIIKPKYLNEALLETPSIALETVRPEIRRMGKRVERMLVEVPTVIVRGSSEDLYRIAAMDEDIDRLHEYVIKYLGKVSQRELSQDDRETLFHLMDAANNLEHIGDTVETNLVALGQQRVERHVTISDESADVIRRMLETVVTSVQFAVRAVVAQDIAAAQVVIGMKGEMTQMAKDALSHQADRLIAPEPDRLALYTVEADVIENLKRIYYFAKRMAKTVTIESESDMDKT